MIALNYTQFRDHMKEKMDLATDEFETLIITRKNNKNVVVMSEEAYNNLIENVYLTNNPANYDWMDESKKQLEKGKVHILDPNEDEV